MIKYGDTTEEEFKAIEQLRKAINQLPSTIQLELDYAPGMMAVWKHKGNGISEAVAELEYPKL